MKQGFKIEFYGKVQFKKSYGNMSRCVISAFDYGYVNVNLVAFKDTANKLNQFEDNDWVQGHGKLNTNGYKGNKTLQIILEDISEAPEPEFKSKVSNTQKPKNTATETEINYDDLEEDLPF